MSHRRLEPRTPEPSYSDMDLDLCLGGGHFDSRRGSPAILQHFVVLPSSFGQAQRWPTLSIETADAESAAR
jgi:hypothetical protein